MSDSDHLRDRLAGLDPAPPAHDTADPRRVSELLERIMATPVTTDAPHEAPRAPRRARTAWLAAAGVATVIAGGAVAWSLQDDSPSTVKPTTTLALSLPDSGVMSSCIQFSTDILRDMSPAFRGPVTDVTGDVVRLSVDHWYTGGSADVVELSQPGANTSATLDGVTFEDGQTYLVTAANGTVNGCGFSGLATPDLQKAFAEAFG